uniref:Uncharacterized protein n=1 Tax=Arundo donax TaxID=35708 RepID=A0A0A9AQZ6_ARUDO
MGGGGAIIRNGDGQVILAAWWALFRCYSAENN